MEFLLSQAWNICFVSIALMGVAFQIAKSTEEELRKVFSWGKSVAYMALMLAAIGFGFASVDGFMSKKEEPSRHEIVLLVIIILLTVWYIKMFFDYVFDVRSRARRAQIERLIAERKDLEEQTLRQSIRADTYEAINRVLRAMTGDKTPGGTPEQKHKDAGAPE
jgi:hypothetical protein